MNHTLYLWMLLWFCWWSSALRQRRAVQSGRWRWGPMVEPVVLPIASTRLSRSVRVRSGMLQWRRRTSWSEPVAPTPSYSAARQGPTSLPTGWASLIRTRAKGPMGCWWRDQSNRGDPFVRKCGIKPCATADPGRGDLNCDAREPPALADLIVS
jgi:hypothetical protein